MFSAGLRPTTKPRWMGATARAMGSLKATKLTAVIILLSTFLRDSGRVSFGSRMIWLLPADSSAEMFLGGSTIVESLNDTARAPQLRSASLAPHRIRQAAGGEWRKTATERPSGPGADTGALAQKLEKAAGPGSACCEKSRGDTC